MDNKSSVAFPNLDKTLDRIHFSSYVLIGLRSLEISLGYSRKHYWIAYYIDIVTKISI